MGRNDALFQDKWQDYINSLEAYDELMTREEWRKVFKTEGEDLRQDISEEEAVALLTWLEEDGFIK